VHPSPTGRPCPEELEQAKPCPSTPCYTWHPSPWSPCHLQGASCGTGVVRRNLSCVVVPGHRAVHSSHCSSSPPPSLMEMETSSLATTASCYVGCDQDCTVSSWSEWSPCSSSHCLPHTSLGSSVRSRSIVQPPVPPHGLCPPHMEESRACLANPCYQYQWVVRGGDVYCQRSDGLRVEAGCKSSIVGCGPSCWTVAHAVCTEGRCTCTPGHLPQFTSLSSPHLTACLPRATNSSLQSATGHGDIRVHRYYPDGKIMNYWMFAMISIGCIFIVFVGVSIYILCRATCRPSYAPGPPGCPEPRSRAKHQEPPLPSLWT